MTRDDFEKLGDLHKSYESRSESSLIPGCPIVVRLDGRSFHTFTKGLKRPYDERLSMAMIETTKDILHKSGADIGYCQSDEISLGFKNDLEIPFMFGGRVQKTVSIIASIVSVRFNRLIQEYIPECSHMEPVFDARVWQYPNLDLACDSFLWRETDATRNSLSMAVQSLYHHKDCEGAGFKKKHDMLHDKGVNWNDYPQFFRRGTYVGKRNVLKKLGEAELSKIPEQFREPNKLYSRSIVSDLKLPEYTKMSNVKEVFFFNDNPINK